MIAANREVDLTMAEQVAEVFTEVVVAPSFTDDALAALTAKKNIRLLRLPHVPGAGAEMRPVSGGLLLQVRGPDRRPRRRPDDLDAGHRRAAGRRRPRRPRLRLARRAGR